MRGNSKYSIWEKIALDRLVFAPAYTVVFFAVITILKVYCKLLYFFIDINETLAETSAYIPVQ